MKNLFIPYPLAVLAKEKGFNEPCFGYYTPMKAWMMAGTKLNPEPHFHGCNWSNEDNTFYFMYKANSFGDRTSAVKNSDFTVSIKNVAVPLYQQIVDWFRENYEIKIVLDPESDCECYYVYKARLKLTKHGYIDKAIESAIKLI